jgi:hypothetical protein
MARISTYQRDTVVTKNDKVIGTDSSGSITKNFKLEDIAGFLRSTNAVGIATQFNFKFVDSSRDVQTISFDPIAPGDTFDNVTSFVLSKFDANNNNISEYLKTYASKQIVIVRLDDYSNFGLFDVASVTDHASLSDYLTVTVTNRTNQGSFVADKYYGLAIFAEGDKHKELSFTTNTFEAGTEVINGSTMRYFDFNHNLNKFPAITATEVGSPDQIAQVSVKHLNKNTVRVYFTGITNGKIYAN